MNIFLTGISGFSGLFFSKYLIEQGHTVFAVSRNKDIHKQNLKNIEIIHNTIEHLKTLPPAIDVIIHAAALSPTPTTTTNDFIRDNALATQNLVNLGKINNVKKFIFFSTLSVYGEIKDPIVTEETPIINPNAYGITKLLGEMCLKDAETQMCSLAIRFPAIIGNGARRHWLANTIEKAQKNQDIVFLNPSAKFNNAIHVHTLARFIDGLLLRSWKGFDVINLASAGYMTIQEIIDTILQKTKSSSHATPSLLETNSFMISTKKAEDLYGYIPINFKKSLEIYLEETTIAHFT